MSEIWEVQAWPTWCSKQNWPVCLKFVVNGTWMEMGTAVAEKSIRTCESQAELPGERLLWVWDGQRTLARGVPRVLILFVQTNWRVQSCQRKKKIMSVMHSSESMPMKKTWKKNACSHGCFTAERRQADCQKQPCKLVSCKALGSLMAGLRQPTSLKRLHSGVSKSFPPRGINDPLVYSDESVATSCWSIFDETKVLLSSGYARLRSWGGTIIRFIWRGLWRRGQIKNHRCIAMDWVRCMKTTKVSQVGELKKRGKLWQFMWNWQILQRGLSCTMQRPHRSATKTYRSRDLSLHP